MTSADTYKTEDDLIPILSRNYQRWDDLLKKYNPVKIMIAKTYEKGIGQPQIIPTDAIKLPVPQILTECFSANKIFLFLGCEEQLSDVEDTQDTSVKIKKEKSLKIKEEKGPRIKVWHSLYINTILILMIFRRSNLHLKSLKKYINRSGIIPKYPLNRSNQHNYDMYDLEVAKNLNRQNMLMVQLRLGTNQL